MKKRLLSAFMALALCLTLLPAPAWAAETENNIAVQANTANVAEVTIDGKTTQYTNIVDAFADAQKAASAAVKLLENVTIPTDAHSECYGIELKGGNITLDLNGHTIQTTGEASSFVMRNAVFYIGGGSLTVQDKSTNGGGKIVQPNGGQAIGVSSGNLTVKSGNRTKYFICFHLHNSRFANDFSLISIAYKATYPALTRYPLFRCQSRLTDAHFIISV